METTAKFNANHQVIIAIDCDSSEAPSFDGGVFTLPPMSREQAIALMAQLAQAIHFTR